MDKNKKNVPKIRFPGFTDPWEQRKLGEIADVTKLAGFEFTEHVVYSEQGNIIALRGLNVKNGHLVLDDVKYIDGSNFSKLGRSKLYIDDILFTYVGTVGEVAIVRENDRFFLAPNVSRIRIKSDDLPQYISHYMRNDNFYNSVIFPLIATSSQPALSMENIRKFDISLPSSKEEQIKISSFFSNLDNLTTLHQRKLEHLKDKKKGLLQKMFPKEGEKFPELRFPGFTEPWEQRKLGEIFHQTVDFINPQLSNIELWSLTIEKGLTPKTDRYDREFLVKKEDKFKVVNPKDFVYNPMNMTLGAIGYNEMDKSVAVSGYYVTMKSNNNLIDDFYMKVWLQTPQAIQLYKMHATGSLIEKQRVQFPTLSEIKFSLPSIEEQQQIGKFLKNIDNFITLHQHKLNHLQQQKKGLLQQMFV